MRSPIEAVLFDAVLFDMDGTLIDSGPAVEDAWSRWGVQRGLEPGDWEFSHGVPARQVVARAVPPEEVDEALAEIEAIELVTLDGIVILPGAAEVLKVLPADRVAIATSCTAALAAARIRHTGLQVPEVLVTADDVAVGKPDPAPYLLAASRLGVDPTRCLAVEDAPAGLASARAAGCVTLAVRTTHVAAALSMADAQVGDLSAVTFRAGADGVRVSLSEGTASLPA